MDTLIALRAALDSWAAVPQRSGDWGEESVRARSDRSSMVLTGG